MVIDNGGIHAIKSVTGTIALEKGKHKVLIKYFDGGGGAVFELCEDKSHIKVFKGWRKSVGRYKMKLAQKKIIF